MESTTIIYPTWGYKKITTESTLDMSLPTFSFNFCRLWVLVVAPSGELYEVKAGMVYLQGKSCVIHTGALQGDTIHIFIPLPF